METSARAPAWRAFRLLCALPLVLLAAACGGGDDERRGEVVTSASTAQLGRAQVDAAVATLPGLSSLIGGAARCDVELRKLTYRTVDPQGRAATASMGLLVPSGCAGPYPTVVYHHGTALLKSFTMSDPANLETFLAYGYFAAQGYVVVMPDYLGYGESSTSYHPWLDAENMGQVSVDALRAARAELARLAVPGSGKLFLTGYSQGGHSTMATQRTMERDHPTEFAITATAPMAGFYALETTFAEAVDAPTDFASILFAYGLTALQKNYGDVYATPAAAFQAPWAATVESLFPGPYDVLEILGTAKLPLAITGTGGLLTDAMAASLRSDPQSPVRRRLAQNDTLLWTPRAPMTMCHGGRDTVVPARNMVLAEAEFRRRGAPVTAVDLEAIPAFKAAIDAQLAAAGTLQVYHAQIAVPLCFSVTKNQVFDPLR
jgi:dienelactone hydrolase